MLFTQMFVVHLVRPAYGTEVNVIGLAQPLEPLMDKNVVHKKVGKSVNRDSKPDKQQERQRSVQAKPKAKYAGRSENEKKVIVLLKKRTWVFAVMVLVQKPEEAMHQVFVSQPCNRLHTKKRHQKN
jgi:hypothetical protein